MTVVQPSGYENNSFGIKVSKPGINVNTASDSQLVYKDNFSTKTYYDQTNARIVEGLLPDGTYGMWVSKPGYNATDVNAVANNELIFNSNYDVFKIVSSGTITVNAPGSTSTANLYSTTLAHGLNYQPAIIAYATGFPTGVQADLGLLGNIPVPVIALGSTNGSGAFVTQGVVLTLTASADSTNVYAQLSIAPAYSTYSPTLIGNYTITYYLLQESI